MEKIFFETSKLYSCLQIEIQVKRNEPHSPDLKVDTPSYVIWAWQGHEIKSTTTTTATTQTMCYRTNENITYLYPTYDVDQSYCQGNIFHIIALWLGQYLDIALWCS